MTQCHGRRMIKTGKRKIFFPFIFLIYNDYKKKKKERLKITNKKHNLPATNGYADCSIKVVEKNSETTKYWSVRKNLGIYTCVHIEF